VCSAAARRIAQPGGLRRQSRVGWRRTGAWEQGTAVVAFRGCTPARVRRRQRTPRRRRVRAYLWRAAPRATHACTQMRVRRVPSQMHRRRLHSPDSRRRAAKKAPGRGHLGVSRACTRVRHGLCSRQHGWEDRGSQESSLRLMNSSHPPFSGALTHADQVKAPSL
jgi:hypothetical protein